jgi:sugar phosphate isomerase/epimerase
MQMNYGQEMAVQSFCFRGVKTNEETAQKVKECGLDRIELCGVHADFADASCFDEVIGVYKDAGVRIVSIGVQGFKGDAGTERNFFEFAKRAGCTTISADFGLDTVPDCYRVAEKLADEFDINLGIHNHGGRHWLGSSQMLAHVFANTSPRIGLMLDTAWALHSHEDPVKMAEQFADRLYGVHLKDFAFGREGQHEDVVVGTGALDLPGLTAVMTKNGFAGNFILEYEGDVNNPVPALAKCVEAVKAL